jgi:hypothetical protein
VHFIPIVALTRGFPLAPVRLVRNPETVPMMADGSLLRSGGETWGPVSPDNVHETGVLPIGESGSTIVAAEAEQVERTRRKNWSRARSEVFVPHRLPDKLVDLDLLSEPPPSRGRTSPTTVPPRSFNPR